MKICVIGGAGYVGLITGLGLAEIRHIVTNIDVDSDRIARLQNGESPIFEAGLETAVKVSLATGRLSFSTNLPAAILASEIIFIAVGTPSRENGEVDLSQVVQVAQEIAQHIDAYMVVVIKSTVPVGTAELVQSIWVRRSGKAKTSILWLTLSFSWKAGGYRTFISLTA